MKKVKSVRQSQLDFINKVNKNAANGLSASIHQMRKKASSSKHNMDNYFLNPASPEYQSLRSNNNFSKRSFLLPEDHVEDYSDSVLVTLQHQCNNPICNQKIDSEVILQNARASYYKDGRTGATKRRFHW